MSVVFNIPLPKLPFFYLALGDALEGAMLRATEAAAHRARAHLVERTQKMAADTGRLAASWTVVPLEGQVGHAVVNPLVYAPVVELGRRPGSRPPPSSVIARWLQRKGMSGKEAKQLAFVVARAIGRRGIRGKHILGGAIPDLKEMAVKEFRRVMLDAAARVAGRAR